MSETALERQAETDRKAIVNAYRGLVRASYPHTHKAERRDIRRAFEYALEAHEGARRKSGEPYILHPIAVAKIVAKEIGLGATSIICALMHDVVEDTFVELSDITREFGKEVATIIDGLTKISGVFDHKSSAQAENFRKMLLTLSDDLRVILIKLADRLHNMRTLEFMKRESQLKIASETIYLYAPLANRLGLQSIKSELEDLSLRYMNPGMFQEIDHKLQKFQKESRYYIQKFTKNVRDQLKAAGLKFHILQRYKSIYSIYSKMMRQDIHFEEVYDLFAIRIILDTSVENEKLECLRVFSILTEHYKYNPERYRDWLTLPKANGYEALHVTVMGPRGRWIECQIRSERMDRVAERGVAAHWKYKESGQLHEGNFVKWLGRIRDLLENPSLNAIEVVKEFKTNLVTDEIFAFTPKGDLVRLPQNSTVLDFAYEIHTNIGHQCIGAKVNNKVVPLKYTLQNGDQVEIINSKKQKPKEEWLQYARTSKAKNRIKEHIRKQRREVIQNGRKIFDWKIRNYEFDTNTITRELLAFFNLPNESEFFFLLGSHKLDNAKLGEFIDLKKEGHKIPVQGGRLQRKRLASRAEFESWLQRHKGVDSDALMIGQDMEVSDYQFAACCQPIKGDDIIGIFNPNQGVEIHRVNCKTAVRLMSNFGRNILKAKWTELHSITFLAGIKIHGTDRQGMMGDLIKVMSSKMKLNIRSITIDSPDEMFEGVFKVFVKSTDELQELKRRLKAVPGVLGVSRLQEIEENQS